MPPYRSGETGKKVGFSKVLLNIASLKQHNCGRFRKRAASAWPGGKLKSCRSLLTRKENEFSHGSMHLLPHLETRPLFLPITVPQNYTVHAPALTRLLSWLEHCSLYYKGCRFASWSGHIPRLDPGQRAYKRQAIYVSFSQQCLTLSFPYFSLSSPPSPSLSLINKNIWGLKKLHGPPALDLKSSTLDFDLSSPLEGDLGQVT